MDKLIDDFTEQVTEAGCAPGSGRYGLRIVVPNDIRVVLPYLNAVLPEADFDPENFILVAREAEQAYSFSPHEIRLARMVEPMEAHQLAEKVVARLNQIWADRLNISPRFTPRKLPSVIDIFKLLPKTNCKKCGYTTCLAFAAALRSGQGKLLSCMPMSNGNNNEKRQKITDLLSVI